MGIFNIFKDEPKTPVVEAHQLHPDAAQYHGKLMAAWALGAQICVLNPETGTWERTDKPAFEPELQYSAITGTRTFDATELMGAGINVRPVTKTVEKRVEVPVEKVVYRDRAVAPAAPAAPWDTQTKPVPARLNGFDPHSQFKRGDIWEDRKGRKYRVLANKRDVFTNYNAGIDPDQRSLVVMRVDDGIKPAVTLRDACGVSAKDDSRTLVRCVQQGHGNTAIGGYMGGEKDGLAMVWERPNGHSNVYLSRKNFEVKFI